MEQPELASAERYGPQAQRLGARDEVNAIVAQWVATLDVETVLKRCAKGGVPSSLIFSIADIFEDAQRGNIQMKESRVGAQNKEIFRDLLGLGDSDLKQMRDEGVI